MPGSVGFIADHSLAPASNRAESGSLRAFIAVSRVSVPHFGVVFAQLRLFADYLVKTPPRVSDTIRQTRTVAYMYAFVQTAAGCVNPMLVRCGRRCQARRKFHGLGDGRRSRAVRLKISPDLIPEPIHILSELGKPVLGIAVIGRVAAGARFLVRDDILNLYRRELPHKLGTDPRHKVKRAVKVSAVGQTVLCDLELYVCGVIVKLTKMYNSSVGDTIK